MRKFPFYVLLILLLSSFGASAAFLDGKHLQVRYWFPCQTCLYGTNDYTVLVGPGNELTGVPTPDAVVNLDISDASIAFDYLWTGGWTGAAFNGFSFFDVFSEIDPITGVTIDPSTNLPGLDMSRISWNSEEVWINWQGLAFSADTIVKINIEGQIPEPGTWVLVGLGLAGLAAFRRK